MFPIELKFDACVIYTHLLTAIEVQFGTKARVVQTNGGGEFKALVSQFNTKGIAPKLVCPHIHHQKGSVERKNGHVVETGFTVTLLAQANLLLRLWVRIV